MSSPLKLDVCLDTNSPSYPLASELMPMLNNVPMPCPKGILEKIVAGDRIDLTNHCCVFEDFAVHRYMWTKFFKTLFRQKMGE